MDKGVLHVVPQGESWAVKREGNERASTTHDTQRDAIESARNLAKEGDDIVIHRPDGTIRERSTYVGTIERTTNDRPVTPSDVSSVGSRVSWQAVLAGGVVALAVYLVLTLLAVAIGVGVDQYLSERTFVLTAAIVMTVTLLASLFLGGYVASLLTAGENPREAIIYGVLVWGTMFTLVSLIGGSLAAGAGSILDAVAKPTTAPSYSQSAIDEMTPEQRATYDAKVAAVEELKRNKTTMAWWSVGTVVLSLLAAMAGAYVGAGPEFVFRRILVPGTPAARATA